VHVSPSSTRVLHSSTKPPPIHNLVNGKHDKEDDIPRTHTARIRNPIQPHIYGPDPGMMQTAPERHTAKKTTDGEADPSDSERSKTLVLFTDNAREMHRLLSHATNADECRLIVDMFFVKSGLQLESVNHDTPYPSPPLEPTVPLPDVADIDLENSLVELFLGTAGEVEVEVEVEEEEVDAEEEEVEEVEAGAEARAEEDDDDEPLSPTDTVVSKEIPMILPVTPDDPAPLAHGNTTAWQTVQEVTRPNIITD
jgi:hypothetical protein